MGDIDRICDGRFIKYSWVSKTLCSLPYLLLPQCRVRALGETDLNPVSGLGKISQLLFAWIQPGNVVANIIAGGVAEAGAQQSVRSTIYDVLL